MEHIDAIRPIIAEKLMHVIKPIISENSGILSPFLPCLQYISERDLIFFPVLLKQAVGLVYLSYLFLFAWSIISYVNVL